MGNKFNITKGNIQVKEVPTVNGSFLKILSYVDGIEGESICNITTRNMERADSNANLIADAFNTYQSTGKLPSELAKENEQHTKWVEVNKEKSNLPQDFKVCRFVPCGNFDEKFIGFIDSNKGEVFFMDLRFYDVISENRRNYIHMNSWLKSQITHFIELNHD